MITWIRPRPAAPNTAKRQYVRHILPLYWAKCPCTAAVQVARTRLSDLPCAAYTRSADTRRFRWYTAKPISKPQKVLLMPSRFMPEALASRVSKEASRVASSCQAVSRFSCRVRNTAIPAKAVSSSPGRAANSDTTMPPAAPSNR